MPRSQKSWVLFKRIVIAVSLIVAFVSSGCSDKLSENPAENPNASSLVKQREKLARQIADEAGNSACIPADPKKQANTPTRESLATLLAYPRQSGAYFGLQILGRAKLEVIKVDGNDQQVYLSLSKADSEGERLENAICRVAINKAKIEVGKEKDGKFVFADYSFLRTPEKSLYLRVPLGNLRFDADFQLKFPYQDAIYAPTLEELHFSMLNATIYGGTMEAIPDSRNFGQEVLYNYGAWVSKPNETSLKRFVADLAKGLQSRESKIQRLADLITREVAPKPEEIPLKVIKRAGEVLMTGEAEYPSRAVLLASMMEQLQEDYLLVYSKDFLTVAVKQGGFPAKNEFQIKFEGGVWLLIDT
ncbi:MAG: hypothetical protein ACKVZH_08980, partial [Blastocatellia bacterium]